VDYLNFNDGEPNDLHQTNGIEDFCEINRFAPGTVGTWNDQPDSADASAGHSAVIELTMPLSFYATHRYADGTDADYTVTTTITDADGASSSPFQTTAVVANVAPTATLSAPAVLDEGGSAAISLTAATDPSTVDTAAGFHYSYAKTQAALASTYATASNDSIGHLSFDDNGTYAVYARIFDKDGGSNDYSTTITVRNVAPTAAISNNGPVGEGNPVNVVLSGASDASAADAVALRYVFSSSAATRDAATFATGSAADAQSFTFNDNGVYTVYARILDKDGGYSDYQTDVTVSDVAPTVGSISTPAAPAAVQTAISVSAPFNDPGAADTHTATWDWGDGTSSAATVQEANGSGTASASHVYSTAGVYTVRLTVTDKDGGSTTVGASNYVVAYDPIAGFVTGGGWIDSPTGAYANDPTLTGRATFGFVSQYQKGATVPTGQTEFQFNAAGLNFHTDTYSWLVVAGAKAQFKGTGTINGAGSYGFLLTATDGQANGGGGVDKFRIKIWDNATGKVVYDNQSGGSDDATPITSLGGGSISIHTK
jgi:PKD repeat protein